MWRLESSLLKKKFNKFVTSDYPDQEVYPNLPSDVMGDWQPQALGLLASSGATDPEKFLNATPTIVVDPGVDQADGTWRGRKFKVTAKVKNPETGTLHGCQGGYAVLRYQKQVVQVQALGINYTLSDNNTQIDFAVSAAGQVDNEAIIRVHGTAAMQDDAAGTFTGTANAGILSVPDNIHFLLVCFGSVPTSKIDIGSFTIAGVTKQGLSGTFRPPSWFTQPATENIRAYFDNQVTLQELVDTLAFSVGHRVVVTTSGRFTLRRLETTTTYQNVALTDADISDWAERLRLDSFINRIIVKYFQVPAGAQTTEFDVTKRKRKKKRQKVTLESEASFIVRNALSRIISGVTVRDDFAQALGYEPKEVNLLTYWVNSTPAQDLANYLYSQWGRGVWRPKCTDISGLLTQSYAGDLVVVYRLRSAAGNISNGKNYRLIDADASLSNYEVDISRLDEVKP
jgi:hypothetical protein